MKAIKILLTNWANLISICNTNIDKGNDAEFYQSCKEKALAGYEEADKLYYKELAHATKTTEETENGSFQSEEDRRRFEQDEEKYLMYYEK